MVNKRLRYFDGQFLKDEDFNDEQSYHLDRERRPLKCLAVSGVCEGLTVTGSHNQVTVSPGMAIDTQGRQMVLEVSRTVDLTANTPPGGQTKILYLFLSYEEVGSDMATEGSEGNRRWHERCKLEALEQSVSQPSESVKLVKLTMDSAGNVTVDDTVCEYSGLRLPKASGNGAVLRYQQDGDINRPLFNGTLRVTGDVTLDQALDVSGNTNVGGTLSVTGNTNLSSNLSVTGNVGIGTTSPNEKLVVTGKIKLQQGVAVNEFSNDGTFANNSDLAVPTEKAVKTYVESVVVTGMIVMWSGASNAVPDGWKLCDGQEGRPNLKNRFIVGAGDEYDIGDTGGAKTVELQLNEIPSHNHSISINSGGSHLHSMYFDSTEHGANIKYQNSPITQGTHSYADYFRNTEYGGSHSHTGSSGHAGGSQAHENRPSYYALAFIIKL